MVKWNEFELSTSITMHDNSRFGFDFLNDFTFWLFSFELMMMERMKNSLWSELSSGQMFEMIPIDCIQWKLGTKIEIVLIDWNQSDRRIFLTPTTSIQMESLIDPSDYEHELLHENFFHWKSLIESKLMKFLQLLGYDVNFGGSIACQLLLDWEFLEMNGHTSPEPKLLFPKIVSLTNKSRPISWNENVARVNRSIADRCLWLTAILANFKHFVPQKYATTQ